MAQKILTGTETKTFDTDPTLRAQTEMYLASLGSIPTITPEAPSTTVMRETEKKR